VADPTPPYREAMKINDPIDNATEAIMSATTTSRYGFAPTAAFAATRASADLRRAREATSAAASSSAEQSHSSTHRVRKLISLLAGSPS